MSAIRKDALTGALMHLVGQSRAFVHQVEGYLDEIGSLHDERAVRVVEAMRLMLAEPSGPGTLRRVEREATALLRSLRGEGADDVAEG